jgi:site-specific DNA recombinase
LTQALATAPGRTRRARAPAAPEVRTLRCAVYTRKSTDEGLDSDFNSLDAQREAGEAFVASQRSEGWACLPDRYDDGGFSGGDMERPALQRLLKDIEAGKVDCVVVYKVDRLSRSLLDFARIMETFERHGASFASVTQQFNTSTSMGRLMLNVLLSFAQFEREIIGERTRDKMAAARKRGKWIGGTPVLGYDIDREAKRLVVNEQEAELVRSIFGAYLETESLIRTVAELDKRGIRMKSWTSKKGRSHGGKPFDKSALWRLLTNVVYVGKVRYGGEVYEGEHEGLLEPALFERAQGLIGRNGRTYGANVRNRNGAILARLLWCPACGKHMTHVVKRKNGRAYRYYTCMGAQKRGWKTCPTKSIPAQEIEDFVVARVKEMGRDPALVEETARQVCGLRAARGPELEAEHARLRDELTGVRTELRTLVHALGRTGSDSAAVTARIVELEERAGRIERRMTEAREEILAIEHETIDSGDLAAALAHFDPVWDVLFPREKRRILGHLIERVEWDRAAGAIEIVFRPAGIKALAAEAGAPKGTR